MGYFPNGTSGMDYQARYCERCLHDNPDKGLYCPIWNLHLLNNYSDCNKPDSPLHSLIPRDESDLENLRCTMFVDRGLMSNLQIEHYETDALAAEQR